MAQAHCARGICAVRSLDAPLQVEADTACRWREVRDQWRTIDGSIDLPAQFAAFPNAEPPGSLPLRVVQRPTLPTCSTIPVTPPASRVERRNLNTTLSWTPLATSSRSDWNIRRSVFK